MSSSRFLTAEWRNLVMLNYEIDREILAPHAPPGTVVDTYQGKAYLSMVGFSFLNTKIMGIGVPFHRDFLEVNLRFYVRRLAEDGWRRGVVFVKEIASKMGVTAVARAVYGERYITLPMRHSYERNEEQITLEYGWEFRGRWNALGGRAVGEAHELRPGSLEEFITEHYWGYVGQGDGTCVEYAVEHPSWHYWKLQEPRLDCDAAPLYGAEFGEVLSKPPASAFLCDGSPVAVYRGKKIEVDLAVS